MIIFLVTSAAVKQVVFWVFGQILDFYATFSSLMGQDCESWYKKDTGPPLDLPPCPPTPDLARSDKSFMIDPSCPKAPCLFHPGADFCVRSIQVSPTGGGQQCCYLGDKLLMGAPGGGTPDKCHSSQVLCHFYIDVLPWVLCCKNNDITNCNKYYEKRPSDNGLSYNKSIDIYS